MCCNVTYKIPLSLSCSVYNNYDKQDKNLCFSANALFFSKNKNSKSKYHTKYCYVILLRLFLKNSERMQIIYFNKVILENNLNFNIPTLKNQKNSSNDE